MIDAYQLEVADWKNMQKIKQKYEINVFIFRNMTLEEEIEKMSSYCFVGFLFL
jgi:hypothetical protein